MKYLIMLGALILMAKVSIAQTGDPVHWSYQVENAGNNTYLLHFKAIMDKGWHIYAQKQPEEAISVPTKISFAKNPLIETLDSIKEFGDKKIQDLKELDIKQYYYADSVCFRQMIKLKRSVKTNISGTITYQACTDEMCLPEKKTTFSLSVQ